MNTKCTIFKYLNIFIYKYKIKITKENASYEILGNFKKIIKNKNIRKYSDKSFMIFYYKKHFE